MDDWKNKLFQRYVSTGQSASDINQIFHVKKYPRYRRFINKHIQNDINSRILELGCGNGALLFCLKEMGYKNIFGVDISQEQIEIANRNGLENILRNDIVSYLNESDEKYNVIIMMDVLEHIEKEDLLELLDNVYKHLNQEGSLIIHVPNGEGVFGMRIRYGDYTHTTCFTLKSIKQVLKASGYKEIQCFEEPPVVHGLKSLIRYIVWSIFIFPYRVLLISETGVIKHILSQNMLVTCKK